MRRGSRACGTARRPCHRRPKKLSIPPRIRTLSASAHMNEKDDFLPTRATLLGRLKDWKDEESWREFFQLYRRLIFSTAIKAGLTEAEAEDVVQETVLSVAKTIKEFQYDPQRCRFKSWLRHLTQKRIADCYRKRAREQPLPETAAGETPRT